MTSARELRRYVDILVAEEEYDSIEGHWKFRSGGSCCRCTDSAAKVARAFGGRVAGYWASNNPSAVIGAPDYEGHDFALIEDRFIVDYWAFRVTNLIGSPVLDLLIGA